MNRHARVYLCALNSTFNENQYVYKIPIFRKIYGWDKILLFMMIEEE